MAGYPFRFGARREQEAGQPSKSGAKFTAFRSLPHRHNRGLHAIQQYGQGVKRFGGVAVGKIEREEKRTCQAEFHAALKFKREQLYCGAGTGIA
jgi:hypothetical protein